MYGGLHLYIEAQLCECDIQNVLLRYVQIRHELSLLPVIIALPS